MALKDDIDTSIASLRAVLQAMDFLGNMGKLKADRELMDNIRDQMSTLKSDHNATFEIDTGIPHEPDPDTLAYWLFDNFTGHRIKVTVAPTSTDETLSLTLNVPIVW